MEELPGKLEIIHLKIKTATGWEVVSVRMEDRQKQVSWLEKLKKRC